MNLIFMKVAFVESLNSDVNLENANSTNDDT